MRPSRWVLLLGLLAPLGCGDEDRTQTDYTASLDKSSTSADDSAATPARAAPGAADTLPTPPAPPRQVGLALAPLPGLTLRGSGRLASAGTGSAITVQLERGTGGASYEGAVRQGSCRHLGSTIASLVPATADSLGRGAAESDVPVPVDSLLHAPHVVVYGRGGRPEACGPVSGGAPAPADSTAR